MVKSNTRAIGRADMLYLSHALSLPDFDQAMAAFSSDYYLDDVAENPSKKAVDKESEADRNDTQHSSIHGQALADTFEQAPQYFVISEVYLENEEETAAASTDVESITSLEKLHKKYPVCDKVKTPPLVPWSKLSIFIKQALGGLQSAHDLNIAKVTRLAAQARPLTTLPYRQRHSWHGAAQILVDYSHRTAPFYDDYNELCRRIGKIKAKSETEMLTFMDDSVGMCRSWGNGRTEFHRYRLPSAGTLVLILSDLGCYVKIDDQADEQQYKESNLVMNRWLKLGQSFENAGFKPVVLIPCPPRFWNKALHRYYQLVCWDRGIRLPRLDNARGVFKSKTFAPQMLALDHGVETLLQLLSPLITVEPELLRTIRLKLPANQADGGSEAGVWLHRATGNSSLGFYISDHQALNDYRQKFKALPAERQAMIDTLVLSHHGFQSLAKRFLELAVCFDLAGEQRLGDEVIDDLQSFWRLVGFHQRDQSTPMEGYNDYLIKSIANLHDKLWDSKQLQSLKDVMARAVSEYAADFKLAKALADDVQRLTPQSDQKYTYYLIQQGNELFIRSYPVVHDRQHRAVQTGVVIGAIDVRSVWIKLWRTDQRTRDKPGTVDLILGQRAAVAGKRLMAADSHRLTLAFDNQRLTIERITKPEGFDYLWQNKDSLCVGFNDRTGKTCREIWPPGMYYAQDRYGHYCEFNFNGLKQKFRWICPGEFLMGSPENEPERYGDELQHQVELTQGFWLAETACTQALWRVIMGDNPSRFKGDDSPVISVSWDDVQKFLRRLNDEIPELQLKLPTEAEWEYACRAGTATPFSFGESITPEQVNYNGQYPYAGGKKGEYRAKTVAVKSLPPNPWGLYEMHGNVWEWCQDWYGDYSEGTQVDPRGPETGSARVLRGGSWFNGGGYVRSANRGRIDPANRFISTGFRLARGQPAS